MTCLACNSHHARSRPTRRALVSTLVSAAVVPTSAFFFPATAEQASSSSSPASVLTGQASPDDERFMRLAIEEARLADFPFGAVIVRDNAVIARGRNLGRTMRDPTAHGEMVAIRRGIADKGAEALRGATIYTSGEPCAMCMGAILWCRMGRLVFAASIAQLATKIDQIMLTSADIAAKAAFDPIAITGGILADEAMQLFGN